MITKIITLLILVLSLLFSVINIYQKDKNEEGTWRKFTKLGLVLLTFFSLASIFLYFLTNYEESKSLEQKIKEEKNKNIQDSIRYQIQLNALLENQKLLKESKSKTEIINELLNSEIAKSDNQSSRSNTIISDRLEASFTVSIKVDSNIVDKLKSHLLTIWNNRSPDENMQQEEFENFNFSSLDELPIYLSKLKELSVVNFLHIDIYDSKEDSKFLKKSDYRIAIIDSISERNLYLYTKFCTNTPCFGITYNYLYNYLSVEYHNIPVRIVSNYLTPTLHDLTKKHAQIVMSLGGPTDKKIKYSVFNRGFEVIDFKLTDFSLIDNYSRYIIFDSIQNNISKKIRCFSF